MRVLAFATAVAALAALATPAMAQDDTSTQPWYAGLGYTHYDTDRGNLGGVTGRLGYHFNQNLGAEAEYTGGVSDDTFGKLRDQWGVYGVASLPVSQGFDVFGRAGYQQMHIDGRNGATSQDTEGLGYGAGVNWHASGNLGIRGEYTRLTDSDADTWSLGGALAF
jgi:hypothetical protein